MTKPTAFFRVISKRRSKPSFPLPTREGCSKELRECQSN